MCAPDGTAILTEHKTVDLVKFLRDLACSVKMKDDCPFELVPINITEIDVQKLTDITDVQKLTDMKSLSSTDSDSESDFSGFEEKELVKPVLTNAYTDHETTADAYLSDSSASDNITLAELKQLLCEKEVVQPKYSTDDDIPLAQSCFSSDLESSGSEYQLTKSEQKKLEKGVSTSELYSTDTEQSNIRQKSKRKEKDK